MFSKYQEALAAIASNAERARPRGQIGLTHQDLTQVRNDLSTALAQVHAQAADLGDRLKASVAAERSGGARGFDPFQPAARQLSC